MKQRAHQEKRILSEEAKRLLEVLEDRIRRIEQRINELSTGQQFTHFKLGSIGVLSNCACNLKARAAQAQETLSRYIEELAPQMTAVNPEPLAFPASTDDLTEAIYDDQLLNLYLEESDDDFSDDE